MKKNHWSREREKNSQKPKLPKWNSNFFFLKGKLTRSNWHMRRIEFEIEHTLKWVENWNFLKAQKKKTTNKYHRKKKTNK